MSDIVERLRQQATVEAKKFGDARDVQIEWRAAEEIERLRARVEVLERTLRHYADDAYNGHNGSGDCARAALEAKP
jgi:hypothetical protein